MRLARNEAAWWDLAWWGRTSLVNGHYKLAIEVTREGSDPATVHYEFDVKPPGSCTSAAAGTRADSP